MIDDATIKRVAHQTGVHGMAGGTVQLHNFARAIAQLARQEQREEDALVCEYEQVDAVATGEPTDAAYNMALAHAAQAIRAAGKENKID